MIKIVLLSLLIVLKIGLFAQNDIVIVKLRLDDINKIVFCIDGLLIEGNSEKYDYFNLKPYHLRVTDINFVDKVFRDKYNYYGDRRSYYIEDIKCITVINDTSFILPDKYKETLINYKIENIDTIYTLKRFEAIKKYGFRKGKNGALIIKTK